MRHQGNRIPPYVMLPDGQARSVWVACIACMLVHTACGHKSASNRVSMCCRLWWHACHVHLDACCKRHSHACACPCAAWNNCVRLRARDAPFHCFLPNRWMQLQLVVAMYIIWVTPIRVVRTGIVDDGGLCVGREHCWEATGRRRNR